LRSTVVGAKFWQFVPTHNCAFYQTAPAVANGVVYAEAHCGNLGGEYLALDAKTGKVLWSYTKAHNPGTPPTIVNGFAYFTSGLDGVVDAFTLPSRT
jgi:outer membrane protein assembly factor BamB